MGFLPQAYAGRRPTVMGTDPELVGNFFPTNSGQMLMTAGYLSP